MRACLGVPAGCSLCPAVSGQLFCFAGGLALLVGSGGVGAASGGARAPWLCDFRQCLEAITLQRLAGGEGGGLAL